MNRAGQSVIATVLDSLPVFGPPRLRLLGLLGLQISSTLAEGFGLGMMLPVAEMMQNNGELSAKMLEGMHWKYLQLAADHTGIPLTIPALMAISMGLFLIRNALLYLRTVLFAASVQSYVRDNRINILDRFLRTRAAFQDSIPVGRLLNDLQVQMPVSAGAVHSCILVLHISFMLLYYLIFLLLLSWQLTLVALAIGTVAAISVRPILRRSKSVGERLLQANQQAASFLQERLNAARLIRLSGTEAKEVQEYSLRAGQQAEGEIQLVRNSSKTSALLESVVLFCGFLLLYAGGRILGMELASIGIAIVVLLRQVPVLRELIIARHSIISNLPSLAYMTGLARQMIAAAEPDDGSRTVTRLAQGISFSAVTFRYPGQAEDVLKGIDLEIPANRVTALVGPSGGGKSTLVDLLPRLREPTGGKILLDGIPIQEFSRRQLRRSIGYTPQTPQIFNISVREHILLGKPDAAEAEIREAARIAGADHFIEAWPEGYDTLLGERGLRLSGGQKQRIDLARALVSGAPILILDEPTSNLDVATEQEFQDMLKDVHERSPRTMIVIGHRLTTVRDADQIVVIQEGRVSEVGSHRELMTRDSWYATAYRIHQAEEKPSPVAS